MLKNYCLVNKQTKIVENTIIWDGESPLLEEYYESYNIILFEIIDGAHTPCIGDIYSSELNKFFPPTNSESEKNLIISEAYAKFYEECGNDPEIIRQRSKQFREENGFPLLEESPSN